MCANTRRTETTDKDASDRNRFQLNKERFKALGVSPKAVIDLTLFCQGREVVSCEVVGVCVVFSYIRETRDTMTRVYNLTTHHFDDVWGDERHLLTYL